MHFHDIILMALGLGMDAMSVCVGIGVKWHGPRQKFRLAWHMGLFQFLMPLLGWLIGQQVAGFLAAWGKYIAAVLVFGVGAKMLLEAIKSHPGAVAESAERAAHMDQAGKDPTRGWSLVVLSVATSIDALVVGFSLALGEGGAEFLRGIVYPSVIIGLVAAAMSLTGVMLGKRAGKTFGKKAEIVGAILLMLLGVSFVLPAMQF